MRTCIAFCVSKLSAALISLSEITGAILTDSPETANETHEEEVRAGDGYYALDITIA